MNHSQSITKLAPALVKANAEVSNALKDSHNPHFGNNFASLHSVLDAVKPVYAKHGLTLVQVPGLDEQGRATLDTMVLHESGEWISGTSGSPLQKADPQGMGSAITYLRRYSLAALAGITQEDDDGNAASHPASVDRTPVKAHPDERVPVRQPAKAQAPRAPQADGEMIDCPNCGGAMWDNRVNKKNPKGPDLKCKDKECDHAIWLDSWTKDMNRDLDAVGAIANLTQVEIDELAAHIASRNPSRMRVASEKLHEAMR